MDKIKEIKVIFSKVGLPISQQSDICCYTMLALSQITETSEWKQANNDWMRIHDVIAFTNNNFGTTYAENSRETFRKQALHHFRIAAMVEDNGVATNSPNYKWRITDEFIKVLKNIGKSEVYLCRFISEHQSLKEMYASKRQQRMMPVKINDDDFVFSPGKHNELQRNVLDSFVPRFASDCICLYIGDTVEKDLVKNEEDMKNLGFSITLHDKMPDIILYDKNKNWIFFIECVTSVGPMDPKRIIEINDMTRNVKSGKIFITAFLDFKTYKEFSDKIAWETEVWIAEMPDHMIHMNGDKFLGPR
jgi:hypothetical protein